MYWLLETSLDVFVFDLGSFWGRMLFAEANEIWMRLVVTSLLIGFGTYAQSVTRRTKRLGAALKASEELYRNLLQSVPVGIREDDLTGKVVFVNAHYANMLRMDARDLVGMPAWETCATEFEKAEMKTVIEKLARDQPEPTPYRTRMTTSDGHRLDVEVDWVYTRDENHDVIGYTSLVVDQSNQLQTLDALHKSEERYRNLFETSRDGIVFEDMSGRLEEANQAYLDLVGYSLEELGNERYPNLTPTKWHEVETIRNRQLEERGYADEYEKEYVRKDGRVVPVSVRAWLVPDDDGNPVRLMGLVRDISEGRAG